MKFKVDCVFNTWFNNIEFEATSEEAVVRLISNMSDDNLKDILVNALTDCLEKCIDIEDITIIKDDEDEHEDDLDLDELLED